MASWTERLSIFAAVASEVVASLVSSYEKAYGVLFVPKIFHCVDLESTVGHLLNPNPFKRYNMGGD